jgi:hypothetical protein
MQDPCCQAIKLHLAGILKLVSAGGGSQTSGQTQNNGTVGEQTMIRRFVTAAMPATTARLSMAYPAPSDRAEFV